MIYFKKNIHTSILYIYLLKFKKFKINFYKHKILLKRRRLTMYRLEKESKTLPLLNDDQWNIYHLLLKYQ